MNNGEVPVLSLTQIRITGSSNEYTEGPSITGDLVTAPGGRTGGEQETQEERPNNPSLSSSVEDSRSVGGPSSGPRPQIIRTQPKRAEEELKPLNAEPRQHKTPGKHSNKCERCGRCPCPECRRPRALPSCWMCGRRCVCSAQSAVEYGSCVCCVKGLFYHCSSDDEDTCADKPFSCSQSHCCVRWSAVSLLALLLPCLLCYLPAKGCVAVCQSCYDRAARPGCRCKNTNVIQCEDVGSPTSTL